MNFFGQFDIVDLTHPITEAMPIWPGDPPVRIERWASIEQEGFTLNRLTIGEHSGTHFGCPAHTMSGGRSADHYEARELVVPCSVISVVEQARRNPDYALSVQDILDFEAQHGSLPERQLVMLHTGWSAWWGDAARYFGTDANGIHHFPGFSADAVRFLIEKRGIVGLGIDTHGIDAGIDALFEANKILFGTGGFHLENVTNLGRLPAMGSVIMIGILPISNGSGSPARVIALVPK